MTMLNKANNYQYGIYYIRKFGDPILNQYVPEVKEFDGRLNSMIGSMKVFLDQNAIGVAAPQVGIQKRIFVWQLDDKNPREIINPEIIDHGNDTMVSEEGCLSLPGFKLKILRYKHVVVEGYNLSEKKVQFSGTGLRAALFQHELDHLNGVLTINSVNKVE